MKKHNMNFVDLEQAFFDGNSSGKTMQSEAVENTRILTEIENSLLGSFDKLGKYKISEKLCNQLVALKKIYTYSYGDSVFCQSQAKFEKFGNLQFVIKIQDLPEKKVASLSVVQTIKKAPDFSKKSAITQISAFEAPKSPSFFADCFAKFNVFSKDEDGLLKKEEANIDLLLARQRYLVNAQKAIDASDDIFQKMIEEKLAVLAKYAVGAKILDEYKKAIANGSAKFVKGQKGHGKKLNMVLDGIIEAHMPEVLAETMLALQLSKINSNMLRPVLQKIGDFEAQQTAVILPKVAMAKKQSVGVPLGVKKPAGQQVAKPEKKQSAQKKAGTEKKPSKKGEQALKNFSKPESKHKATTDLQPKQRMVGDHTNVPKRKFDSGFDSLRDIFDTGMKKNKTIMSRGGVAEFDSNVKAHTSINADVQKPNNAVKNESVEKGLLMN